MNAVIALALIGLLWIVIAGVLAASTRLRSLQLLDNEAAGPWGMRPVPTWRDVPENRTSVKTA